MVLIAAAGISLYIVLEGGPGTTDSTGSYERGGPLILPNAHVSQFAFKKGDVFTDGFETLQIQGTAVVIIDRIQLLGTHGYFHLVGALAAGDKRSIGSIQVTPTYPPNHPELGELVEATGATVPPGKIGLNLSLGLRVDGDGRGERTGLRVFYTADGKKYYQDLPAGIVNCPPGGEQESCDQAMSELLHQIESEN